MVEISANMRSNKFVNFKKFLILQFLIKNCLYNHLIIYSGRHNAQIRVDWYAPYLQRLIFGRDAYNYASKVAVEDVMSWIFRILFDFGR